MAELADEMKALFEQKSALVESGENKRRLNMWEPGFAEENYEHVEASGQTKTRGC